IIGVVADTLDIALEKAPEPQFFIEGYSAREAFLVVRTVTGAPESLQKTVLNEIAAVDKDLPVLNVKTMERMVSDSLDSRRFQMAVLAAFAISALVLTAVGVFSAVARSVARRTPEIGIRIALGAQWGNIIRLVIGDGMKPVLLGLLGGLIGALAVTRVLVHQLFGISSVDSVTYLSVALILVFVALLACWLPARRATKIDPTEALRNE
ncbi:FtsX-like permease family protein, partial [bacterium]|nr:FtsX-like permease family protein [bacterium]